MAKEQTREWHVCPVCGNAVFGIEGTLCYECQRCKDLAREKQQRLARKRAFGVASSRQWID
jgi:predicted nucleic acid-binding Zn ribbon protein